MPWRWVMSTPLGSDVVLNGQLSSPEDRGAYPEVKSTSASLSGETLKSLPLLTASTDAGRGEMLLKS